MKMNLNIKFSFAGVYSKAKQNISIVLVLVLAMLLLLEIWTVKGSWGVLVASKDNTLIIPPKLIRVNFSAYNSILSRMENAAAYDPEPLIQRNPFGVHEKGNTTDKTN